jgi:hypothetical protein
VIVKGIAVDFDVEAALEKFCKIFGISSTSINEKYKFTLQLTNRETSKKFNMYILTISFVRKIDKKEVLAKEQEMAGLTLDQLVDNCPTENKAHRIKIYHCLTKPNLAVQKKLLKLKTDGKIAEKSFKSNLFHYKVNSADEIWIPVTTIRNIS